MKRLTFLLLAVLFVAPAIAQNTNDLFNQLTEKYADTEGFSANLLTADMFDLYIKKRNIEETSPVFDALKKTGNSILKLDAGTEEMFRLINGPAGRVTLASIVEKLIELEGELIIQTLFLRGKLDEKIIDNTSEAELSAWMGHLRRIRPKYVMIYPIDRETPLSTLEKVPFDELKQIAEKVEAMGIKTQVYY